MYIIFTDLDGTLLDHYTYSFDVASEALKLIKAMKIPLIIVTSKTASEVIELQKKLKIKEPFVVENGGGLYIPNDYYLSYSGKTQQFCGYKEIVLGERYEMIRSFADLIKEKFKVSLFSDMSSLELSKFINLSLNSAERSLVRRFSEPFFFNTQSVDIEVIEKIEILAVEHRLRILRGGRFFHIVSCKQDKGKAVDFLISLFRHKISKKITTIGLGDSNNDISMLRVVDIPILVKKHTGLHEFTNINGLIKSDFIGPLGWNSSILEILSR